MEHIQHKLINTTAYKERILQDVNTASKFLNHKELVEEHTAFIVWDGKEGRTSQLVVEIRANWAQWKSKPKLTNRSITLQADKWWCCHI